MGKGTYAKRICLSLQYKHLGAGDLVRAEIKRGSAFGEKAVAFSNSGQLIPDEDIVSLLRSEVQGSVEGLPLLLDGFPRTQRQVNSSFSLVARTFVEGT